LFIGGELRSRRREPVVDVFLSYRRSDVGGYAGRLLDALVQRLGATHVFQDVSTIAPGQDFSAAIGRALDRSDAMLAVIGPGWLAPSAGQARSRLFEPDDYVRLEIGAALTRDVRVVPVLVGHAQLPTPDDLPPDLQPLLLRQGVVLHDETWHEDVRGLLASLRGERAPVVTRRRRILAGTAAGLVLATGATWAVYRHENPPAVVLPSCLAPEASSWQQLTLDPSPTADEETPDGVLTFTVKDAYWQPQGDNWHITLDTRMKDATPGSMYHGDYRYDALAVGEHQFDPTCFSSVPDLVEPGAVGDARVGFQVTCPPEGRIELVLENGVRLPVTDRSLAPAAC